MRGSVGWGRESLERRAVMVEDMYVEDGEILAAQEPGVGGGEKGRGQMGWKDRVDFRRIRVDKMVRLRCSIIGLD